MKNFLLYVLATIVGIILASLIFFFIMLATFSVMVASGDKSASVGKNSVLVLKSGMSIPDRTDPNPFAGFDIINMCLRPRLNDIWGILISSKR